MTARSRPDGRVYPTALSGQGAHHLPASRRPDPAEKLVEELGEVLRLTAGFRDRFAGSGR
jgi:hypothetical protein